MRPNLDEPAGLLPIRQQGLTSDCMSKRIWYNLAGRFNRCGRWSSSGEQVWQVLFCSCCTLVIPSHTYSTRQKAVDQKSRLDRVMISYFCLISDRLEAYKHQYKMPSVRLALKLFVPGGLSKEKVSPQQMEMMEKSVGWVPFHGGQSRQLESWRWWRNYACLCIFRYLSQTGFDVPAQKSFPEYRSY